MIVAIGTAVWSGWYSQRTASRRELLSWRRSELLQATSELAQLSLHRLAVLVRALDGMIPPGIGPSIDPFNTTVSGGPHPRHSVDQMMVIVERIELLDSTLAEVARRLAEAHRQALIDAEVEFAMSGDSISHCDAMIVDAGTHKSLHTELTQAFRRAVALTTASPEVRR
ncbi:hypothetical protein [Mycolicibacterium llatzerense]|uniref:hypothetical protein n=1 Tax=Mycolicibacterium llatzerense TaxID=280871 RepID=UPI0031CE2569